MLRDEAEAMFLTKLLVQGIAVKGGVANHLLGFDSRETFLNGRLDEPALMRRSAGDAVNDRKTMAVCDRHDFAAFSAASQADSSAPSFAELKLASMKVSQTSSWPRARKYSVSA